MQERTGFGIDDVVDRVEALIITRGGDGSVIHTRGSHTIEIPVAKARSMNDPTGCGDAFRAGLLYGLSKDMDWDTAGRIASLMGAIKMEHHGTQNHRFARDEFSVRFREEFGYDFV